MKNSRSGDLVWLLTHNLIFSHLFSKYILVTRHFLATGGIQYWTKQKFLPLRSLKCTRGREKIGEGREVPGGSDIYE